MDPCIAAAVAEAHRRDWGFVLAATARITRDLDAAEDCVQDAYAQALAAWPVQGVPARPAAWLTVVARRKAMNFIHRNDTLSRKLPLLAGAAAAPGPADDDYTAADTIPDDRLRLIFTCCHPALAAEARVALTLRLLCGLTTSEVASAFLVSEPTMAARITRANLCHSKMLAPEITAPVISIAAFLQPEATSTMTEAITPKIRVLTIAR